MKNKVEKRTRRRMERNARNYNNILTKAEVKGMNNHKLLCFCHPADRKDFIRDLRKEQVIEEEEEKNLKNRLQIKTTR